MPDIPWMPGHDRDAAETAIPESPLIKAGMLPDP